MTQSRQSESTSNEIAISVKGLSKAYRIWRDPSARLKAPIWDAVSSFVPVPLRPKALKQRLHTKESPAITRTSMHESTQPQKYEKAKLLASLVVMVREKHAPTNDRRDFKSNQRRG